MRAGPTPLVIGLFVAAHACTMRHEPGDAGAADAGADGHAAVPDASAAPGPDAPGAVCGCLPGPHVSHVYVLSDDAELYAFDPVLGSFAYVLGPVCAGTGRPYSMAVDPRGRAWILDADSRRVHVFDILSPGACTDSGLLPIHPAFPLFGMGFSSPDASAECASLYVHAYSGAGPFSEGPGLGHFGVVEGAPPGIRTLGSTDYDGAEVTGTGDGRVFAFAGVSPAALVELDRTTGAVLDTLPLAGLPRTNASAFAFFGGDFYLFTEALPTEDCHACFESACAPAWASCAAAPACRAEIDCAIERGDVSDTCGGGAGAEMLACLGTCSAACLLSPRARRSQVARLDWDRSDGGPDRALTIEVPAAPIRVVGAGTSPCVPTVPF